MEKKEYVAAMLAEVNRRPEFYESRPMFEPRNLFELAKHLASVGISGLVIDKASIVTHYDNLVEVLNSIDQES